MFTDGVRKYISEMKNVRVWAGEWECLETCLRVLRCSMLAHSTEVLLPVDCSFVLAMMELASGRDFVQVGYVMLRDSFGIMF